MVSPLFFTAPMFAQALDAVGKCASEYIAQDANHQRDLRFARAEHRIDERLQFLRPDRAHMPQPKGRKDVLCKR